MPGFLADVDARTQLAGQNRLELLLFRLNGTQRYGINVFKVKEVIQCPPLTEMPCSNRAVRGITNMRGVTMSVMDLAAAIGQRPIVKRQEAFLLVTEYNKIVQGFLVASVDRIINRTWEEVLAPPKGGSSMGYLTAVTHVDNELIEIIDVERVLKEVMGDSDESSVEVNEQERQQNQQKLIFIVDDSVVARNQVKRTMEHMGLDTAVARDGREALELLSSWKTEDAPDLQRLALIISDIEMPQMDGYTLVTKLREDDHFKQFPVVLHTSLSGGFNQAMVEKVGANEFIPKFDPQILTDAVKRLLG